MTEPQREEKARLGRRLLGSSPGSATQSWNEFLLQSLNSTFFFFFLMGGENWIAFNSA